MRWSIRKILTSYIFLYICRLLSSDNFSICFFPFHLEETSEISFVLSSRLIYSSHLTFIYQTCRVTKRNCSSFSCSLAFGFRDGVLFPRQPWGKVSLPVWTTAWESPQRDATTHKLDLTTSITSTRIRTTLDYCTHAMMGEVTSESPEDPHLYLVGICCYFRASFVTVVPGAVHCRGGFGI